MWTIVLILIPVSICVYWIVFKDVYQNYNDTDIEEPYLEENNKIVHKKVLKNNKNWEDETCWKDKTRLKDKKVCISDPKNLSDIESIKLSDIKYSKKDSFYL